MPDLSAKPIGGREPAVDRPMCRCRTVIVAPRSRMLSFQVSSDSSPFVRGMCCNVDPDKASAVEPDNTKA